MMIMQNSGIPNQTQYMPGDDYRQQEMDPSQHSQVLSPSSQQYNGAGGMASTGTRLKVDINGSSAYGGAGNGS